MLCLCIPLPLEVKNDFQARVKKEHDLTSARVNFTSL